jgi:hypothetical protein
MTVPFDLTRGRNDISATLFRGAQESEPSPIVTWILDLDPPKITVTSPKNGAAITDQEVTIKGTTQAGTTLVARNDGNGTSISSVSGKDGSFAFGLPLAPGSNAIHIAGTDPAGNVGETTLTLLQGSGEMGVSLSASTTRISVSKPPDALQLVVFVTDPAGAPLPGATAFFTVLIPGLAPISKEVTTSPDGRALFTTALVGSMLKGPGTATVEVSHELYGQSTGRVALTFVK